MRTLVHKCLMLGALLSCSAILSGQYSLTIVDDPQLNGVTPVNIIQGPDGSTLLFEEYYIYSYTDHVAKMIDCGCWEINDVTFVADTLYIADDFNGIYKYFHDSVETEIVSGVEATKLISNSAGELFGIRYLEGISYGDPSNMNYYNTSNSAIPTDVVYDIALDKTGVLWMATDEGLVSWNGTIFSSIPTPGNLSEALFDIEIDSAGNKWVASAFGGVGKYSGTQWTTYPETFDPLQRVENLAIINGNEIWTSQNGEGLYRYSNGAFEFIPFADLGVADWEFNRVLYGDAQDRLWIINDWTPIMYLTANTVASNDVKNAIKEINVFPNPAQTNITLTFENTHLTQVLDVKIFTMDGEIVHSQLFTGGNVMQIDIAKFASGLYEVVVNGSKGTLYKGRITKL